MWSPLRSTGLSCIYYIRAETSNQPSFDIFFFVCSLLLYKQTFSLFICPLSTSISDTQQSFPVSKGPMRDNRKQKLFNKKHQQNKKKTFFLLSFYIGLTNNIIINTMDIFPQGPQSLFSFKSSSLFFRRNLYDKKSSYLLSIIFHRNVYTESEIFSSVCRLLIQWFLTSGAPLAKISKKNYFLKMFPWARRLQFQQSHLFEKQKKWSIIRSGGDIKDERMSFFYSFWYQFFRDAVFVLP